MDNTDNKNKDSANCGCQNPPGPINITLGAMMPPSRPSNTPWIIGNIQCPAGKIPQVSTILNFGDKIGSFKVRWAIGRTNYRVPPGLYAVGNPDDKSPVMVSANYKMSFDRLRSNLDGLDCWIMVIDTKGINVWCAAGKGTFGTEEIVRRIELTRLDRIVSHRRLIVPQLGAPGVAAHKVKERTGFRVIYGPVNSQDIIRFLDDGMKATPDMRQVKFELADRAALIPCDLVQSFKYLLTALIIFFILSGIGRDFYSLERMLQLGPSTVIILLLTYIFGSILPPLLLPYLPGRAFAIKGAWIGLAMGIVTFYILSHSAISHMNDFIKSSWILMITALVSFIAMNFTGNSTYTSLSGVKREMKIAVPLQAITAAIGLGLWIVGLFI